MNEAHEARRSPSYALAIFDFDGTLANSGDWFLSIVDDLARRFRFRAAHDDVEMLRGLTSREVIRHLGISRWKLPAIARHVHQGAIAGASRHPRRSIEHDHVIPAGLRGRAEPQLRDGE